MEIKEKFTQFLRSDR